jgi:hypothetical protein
MSSTRWPCGRCEQMWFLDGDLNCQQDCVELTEWVDQYPLLNCKTCAYQVGHTCKGECLDRRGGSAPA